MLDLAALGVERLVSIQRKVLEEDLDVFES
jgi:hypothetical protein